jgi:long-chain acyl-CoA synthetase
METFEWLNENLNPFLGVENLARFSSILLLYKLWMKKRQIDTEILKDSYLDTIPPVQSIASPNPNPGESPIYRNYLAPLYPDPLPTIPFAGVTTLYENFKRSVRLFPGQPCLGHRPISKEGEPGPYQWRSYLSVYNQLTNVGSGLVSKCGLKAHQYMGIFMINRPEWVILEQACNAYSLVTVPLYDTLGYTVVEFITNETQLTVIACSKETLPKVALSAPHCPSLKYVICVDDITKENQSKFLSLGITLLTLVELENAGSEARIPHHPPQPSDVATLCYTSGESLPLSLCFSFSLSFFLFLLVSLFYFL